MQRMTPILCKPVLVLLFSVREGMSRDDCYYQRLMRCSGCCSQVAQFSPCMQHL